MTPIWQRRSVRAFTDKMPEEKKISRILSAGMYAPSAANQRPWEFIVVDDPDIREKIAGVSPYATPAREAPVVLVLLGNMKDLTFPQYWEQDMSACTQNILLECAEQGLGAVWMGIAPEKDRMSYLSDLFSLPEHVKPFCVIPLGYPMEGKGNGPAERDDVSRIRRNVY